MPTRRQSMLAVLRRERDDIVPMSIEFDAVALKKYAPRLGNRSAGDFFDHWYREVWLHEEKARRDLDYGAFYAELPPDATIDVWGQATCTNPCEAVFHYHPMQGFTEVGQIDDYPFPDFSRSACRDGVRERVDRLKEQDLVAIGMTARVVFPISWQLRGMTEFMMDLAIRPAFAERLLDRVTACQLEIVRALAEAGVDVLWLGIDVATQTSTMISPEMWGSWIKPRMGILFNEAKRINPDIILAIHCCGAVTPILDHLVDLGVTIVNPVQPEAIDLPYVKAKYGQQVTFWGGVSVQHTLPFGTPEQVKNEVEERVKVLGRGGGYVVCPAHHIPSDVPWENILAFVEQARLYG